MKTRGLLLTEQHLHLIICQEIFISKPQSGQKLSLLAG